MYTYPEALNAMEKIARDLFKRAMPGRLVEVRVVADSKSGTASVDWVLDPSVNGYGYNYVTINMPVKPATYRMTEQEFQHWAAYNLHEVGHPLHTDKTVWQQAVAAGQNRLLNALEDVREEKATIDLGIALNATEAFSSLIESLHIKAVAGGYDPNGVQSIGWTLSYLGRAANGYNLNPDGVTKRLDPKGIVGQIVPWALKDLAACTSTQDAYDLAQKVIAAVNAAKKVAKVDKSKPEPKRDGKSEVRGGKSEDRGEPKQKPEQEPEQEPGGDVPEESAAGGGQKREGDAVEQQDPDGSTSSAEPEKEFTDADVEATDLKPNERDELASNNVNGVVMKKVITAMRRVANSAVGDRDVSGRDVNGSVALVTGDASRMGQQRALLARAMKRNEEDTHDTGRLSGRLNGRALAKVVARDGRVFGKRSVDEGYDTDVQILVDGSSSMGGLNILAASTLALVVAQAAAQVGVACTTHLFNDSGLIAATRGRSKPVSKKFAYMVNHVNGGTPLSENMLRAVKLQKARAGSKRKVLFLITDGGCNSGPLVVKACGEYIERVEGVEIANLHIGRTPLGLFRNEVAVNVREVSKTGLRQLTNLLEKGI